jgi:hypothetical protein
MRRAVMAGARTIEHGDGGTAEVFVDDRAGRGAVSDTAAGDATSRYGMAWHDPEPAGMAQARELQAALIGRHHCRVLMSVCFRMARAPASSMMVAYGMPALAALKPPRQSTRA